jgi:hypothetical protein
MNATSVDISANLLRVSEFKEITTFADIGGFNGFTSQRICRAFAHLKAIVCDLE